MAERFYSIPASDEGVIYMNYSVAQQQQQRQQQQQQHYLAMSQVGSVASLADFEFLANPHFYYATAGGGASAAPDLNNNSTVSYYNGASGRQTSGSHNMMTKYLNASMSHATAGGMLLPPPPPPPPLTAIVEGHGAGCHYALANGTASCYNRNRYTPYSHNRACAAALSAAAAAAATQSSYPPPPGYQPQPYAGYGQRCQGGTAVLLAPTTSAAAAQQLAATTTSSSLAIAASRAAQGLAPTALDAAFYEGAALLNTTAATHTTYATPTVALATAGSGSGAAKSSVAALAKLPGGAAAVTTTASHAAGSSIVSSTPHSSSSTGSGTYLSVKDPSQTVTLQITNLDYSMDEASLRSFLLGQLKPITPVVSLTFEGSSYAKVTVPDLFFAKQVVSNLHRKKIGHKRMLVSYTRDSSLTEINTLRCQVAGLLKDVPYYTLPMYKFRELFQSRFKTSISVLDLYKMPDVCTINTDSNEEKFICLQPELEESSPLMEGLQHSVPYCTAHFKREQHKGWAEQEIEPLPNVHMSIAEIQQIIYPLLKAHPGDIPVASLVHCIEGELAVPIVPNDSGVNLEHLVCCVQGIQIQVNNFGIKILGWLEPDKSRERERDREAAAGLDRGPYAPKNAATVADSLYLISREVIELVKMSPKATMKFNRFIPAYHNHFGKQCRVADYGYTKLIELFEALSSVVQIMGDGENRQITLTHRTQIRRFTSDLLRVLRAHGNKSVLLSQLPAIFAQTQYRTFDVTDYGVCDIVDILDGLVHSNIVAVSSVQGGKDLLISMPRRKQTGAEIDKTATFAAEMVELFGNAPQYAILFQKFVRSYHYHFAYQCRLSDYGFLKLADLMEAIQGVVEMELTSDEDRKIFLSPRIARRVFAEQCEELIRCTSGLAKTCIRLDQVLELHKKKYGYQIQAQTLGVRRLVDAVALLPYVELVAKDDDDVAWLICHSEDALFRTQCYRAMRLLLDHSAAAVAANAAASKQSAAEKENVAAGATLSNKRQKKELTTGRSSAAMRLDSFVQQFNEKHKDAPLTAGSVRAMRHVIELHTDASCGGGGGGEQCVRLSSFAKFLLNAVHCLEQRPAAMLLHELRHALDCSHAATYDFGYPNLYTLLAAYPDLFTLSLGVSQERSEVALSPNCELRNTAAVALLLGGATRLSNGGYTKPKAPPPRLTRPPLGEHNGRGAPVSTTVSSVPPPAKTRAIDSASYRHYNPAALYYQQQQPPAVAAKAPPYKHAAATPSATSAHHNTSAGSSSIYSAASHHSGSLLNTSGSNKENNSSTSFNTSLNLFNSSFNSSGNCSFAELNSSLNLNTSAGSSATLPHSLYASTKLWERRQQQQQQQQHYQQQLQTHYHAQHAAALAAVSSTPNSSLLATYPPALPVMAAANGSSSGSANCSNNNSSGCASEQLGLYEFVQMCPNYEPPKPDTPPSENMPFWINPIWSNNNGASLEQSNSDLLNIKLPELKTFNVLPMLLSPYTLSKTENMKQQLFNFENHDRKIA